MTNKQIAAQFNSQNKCSGTPKVTDYRKFADTLSEVISATSATITNDIDIPNISSKQFKDYSKGLVESNINFSTCRFNAVEIQMKRFYPAIICNMLFNEADASDDNYSLFGTYMYVTNHFDDIRQHCSIIGRHNLNYFVNSFYAILYAIDKESARRVARISASITAHMLDSMTVEEKDEYLVGASVDCIFLSDDGTSQSAKIVRRMIEFMSQYFTVALRDHEDVIDTDLYKYFNRFTRVCYIDNK